jgi:uncharacterized protein DUF5681
MSTETATASPSAPFNAPSTARDRPVANAGQFQPGQSGNPAGRPRGSRNRSTMMIAALLDEDGPRLMREAIDRALDGDSLLLRCCVTRMVPVPRGRPVELELAEGKGAGDVLASLAATVRAMAEGTISPLEAADVAVVLEGQRRAIETHDLERRLRRLEEVAENDAEVDEGAERLVLPDAVLDAPLDEPYEPPEHLASWQTR